MYVEKIYPNQRLRELYEEAELPFPDADAPNNYSANITDNKDQTFENYKVDKTENTSKQLDQNRYDAVEDTYKLLQERKAEVTNIKEASEDTLLNLSLFTMIGCPIIIWLLITALILVSPFFAIGVTLAVIATVILFKKSITYMDKIKDYHIEKMCIDILLEGLKDKIPTNNISAENNTELFNSLEKAVNSAYWIGGDLIYYAKLCKSDYSDQNTESKQVLRNKVNNFIGFIFGNTELTDNLYKLGFDVGDVQNSIYKYIENLTIDQLYKIILK
jgi:ABC-type multidrug transport system fused ATPase/permease subunit